MSGSGATHESFIQRYLSKPPSPATQRHSGKRSSDQGLRNSLKLNGSNDMSMSYSRTPESQNVLDRISTFCSEDNLLQRASFLDQELSVFGYPSLLSEVQHKNSSSGHSKQHLDLISLVNITYDLMQCWKHSIESQNDASDLQRMTESESARFRHMVSRLKEDLAAKDRDLKSKELMHLQMNQRIESLKKKLKIEQEKGKRLSSELTMRDTQFRHEKKKKMQEIERLQARLQQLLQDKRQERILGIEILNSLQRADGKRGKWNTDKTKKSDEQDMYRLIILNYEDAQKHLLKENESMRKYLKEMQGELISALNEKNTLSGSQEQNNLPLSSKLDRNGEGTASTRSSSAASNESDGSEVSEPMSDGMFEMPYDLVKNDIEKSIRSKWRTLKKEIRKTRMKESNPEQPKTVESFNDNDYEDLVQQQQELIDYLTTANNDEGTERPIPEDCYFLEEKAEFEKQKNMFSQQQSAFEKERKLYADALIQLEDQKQDFESEKNKWLQQNFLQLTPFRGDSKTIGTFSPLKNLKGNERKSRQSQSFKPRRSASPDRSTLKRTEQSKNFHNQSHLEKISPNTISHTLSRLHSSSHQNSFSPDNQLHRSPDVAWQDPSESQRGHAHKAKSSPATSADVGGMLPPSTAELYRSLGLVYYGNDKENVEMTENRNSAPSHFSSKFTRSNENQTNSIISQSFHQLQDREMQAASSSPEYLSAAGSDEEVNQDGSKLVRSPVKLTSQISQKHTTRSPGKDFDDVDSEASGIPFVINGLQISRKLPEPGTSFKFSESKRKHPFASKSLDEKRFQDCKKYDEESMALQIETKMKSRNRKSGIKSFMKSLMNQGKSKPKTMSYDSNNNNLQSSQLHNLSISDSALSLKYYLDQDKNSQLSPHPSGNVQSKNVSSSLTSTEYPVMLEESHQRTRSLPGNEISKTSYDRFQRTNSYGTPNLSESAERHKFALMSLTGKVHPYSQDDHPLVSCSRSSEGPSSNHQSIYPKDENNCGGVSRDRDARSECDAYSSDVEFYSFVLDNHRSKNQSRVVSSAVQHTADKDSKAPKPAAQNSKKGSIQRRPESPRSIFAQLLESATQKSMKNQKPAEPNSDGNLWNKTRRQIPDFRQRLQSTSSDEN